MGTRPRPVDDDIAADGSREGEGDALRRAKALAAPTRVAVLEHLRRAGRPCAAQEVADALGVHHTAVRQHLTLLVEAGLVGPVPMPPQGRGRPKVLYRALADPDPYQHLALMLSEVISEGFTPRTAGHRQGLAVEPSPAGPLATLFGETERLGFRPRVRDRGHGTHELLLAACPFAEVAAVAPATVCDLHRGIAEGVCERSGGLEVVDLHVADPHRGGCRLVVQDVVRDAVRVTT
jgi:predicted ArsR family transcriptional regulator